MIKPDKRTATVIEICDVVEIVPVKNEIVRDARKKK